MIDNGNYNEYVLRQAREMLKALSHGDMICHMRRALYGLKQADRA